MFSLRGTCQTRLILKQNVAETKEFAPSVSVTEYFGEQKDLTGDVVHMTYASAVNLFVKGITDEKGSKFDPNSFGFIVCDEGDLGLGEETFKVYRSFPNALKMCMTATPDFASLDTSIKRGIVKEEEEWVQMFRNPIHTLGLEEAQERGILVPADIYLFETNAVVADVEIKSDGEYRQADIEKYLNIESRNALVLALLLGVDKLKKNINFTEKQKIEIQELHEAIKGKRKAIFGISINHIKELEQELREYGVSVASIHSETPQKVRDQIQKKYRDGEVEVILGVDLIGRGWDSPETEVTIDTQPNYSGRKLKQKFGRGLRLSPETGKERLLAIQLVDQFEKRGRSAVLLSDLYDPEFVISGSHLGQYRHNRDKEDKRGELIVSFSGMDMQVVVEQAKSKELIKTRFAQGSVVEIADLFEKLIQEKLKEFASTGNYELFTAVVRDLPARIPFEAQEKALQALANMDSNTRKIGQRAFLLLNMKSLLTVVDSFFIEGVDSLEDREEMFSVGIESVALKLPDIRMNREKGARIAQQVYLTAKSTIAEFVAEKDNLPSGLIGDLDDRQFVIRRIQEIFGDGNVVANEELKKLAEEFNMQTGADKKTIFNWLTLLNTQEETEDDSLFEDVSKTMLGETMDKVLDTLHERERRVIELTFGLKDGEKRTLKEVGREFGISSARIWSIRKKALGKLRHYIRSEWLKDFLEPMGTGYIGYPVKERRGAYLPLAYSLAVGEGEQDEVKTFQPITRLNGLDISDVDKSYLEQCGIWEIGDFLTMPIEELKQKWRARTPKDIMPLVQNIAIQVNKLCKNKLQGEALIKQVFEFAISRDREKALAGLSELEKRAIEAELFNPPTARESQEARRGKDKIFSKAIKELEIFAFLESNKE